MMHYINRPATVINNSVQQITRDIKKEQRETLSITKEGNYVKRPIKAKTAEYYYTQNEALANVVDIKQEDIIKTNYLHIESDNIQDQDTILFFENILNNNKKELSLIIGDHTLYGAGAGEISVIDENTTTISHTPQTQLEIILYKHSDGIEYPLCEIKDYTGKVTGYNQLFNFFYPEDFPTNYKKFELGYTFWYGGGQFHDFYDKTFYTQLIQDILSQISIKELDTNTFNTGNQLSGIVYINKSGVQSITANPLFTEEYNPEVLPEEEPESLTSTVLPANVEILKKEINKAGLGNAFFYEETDDPMQMNYINLTNNNQDYVLKKLQSYKDEVYRRAKIPKERLMDSSVKESMNSQKTVAIWAIYLNSLNSQQQDLEQQLSDYLLFIYDFDLNVNIDVPEFEEFKIARAQLAMDLFNNAGLTHESYITRLNNIYEWVDMDNLNEWYSKEYFYNGKILSDMTDTNEPDINSITSIGGIVEENRRNR